MPAPGKNGERYVGQTIDLVSRISSHRRRWDDIVAVSFVECGPEDLNDLERAMIADAERQHKVRNRAFTKMPGGPSELDFVVDVQQQAEWLNGVQPAYPLDERTRAAERRHRTRKKFVELSEHPDYPEALDDLTTYVNAVIPWPSVTGGLYWGVSAVPGTGRTADRRRLFTVNAHNVELLFMLHFPKLGLSESYLNVDSKVLERKDCRDLDIERTNELSKLQRRHLDLRAARRDGGADGAQEHPRRGPADGAGPHAPWAVELREVPL